MFTCMRLYLAAHTYWYLRIRDCRAAESSCLGTLSCMQASDILSPEIYCPYKNTQTHKHTCTRLYTKKLLLVNCDNSKYTSQLIHYQETDVLKTVHTREMLIIFKVGLAWMPTTATVVAYSASTHCIMVNELP